MSHYVSLEAPFTWERLGQILKITGVALAPGVYTGLEGKTIKYPADVIKKAAPTLLGKTIVYPHTLSDDRETEVACGFISEAGIENDAVTFVGFVYDPQVQKLVETGQLSSTSIEAITKEEFDPEEGLLTVSDLTFTTLALTEAPACPACRITSVEAVALEEGSEASADENKKKEDLRVMEEETKPVEQELERPGKTEFFARIEEELKKAGVPEDVIPKVLTVLKALVKVPYPYPYPYPKPKAEELPEFKQLKAEVETLQSKLASILTAKKEAILAEIKKLDKKFDESKFFRTVEDLELQITMLESYLETVRRLKPPTKLELTSNIDDVVKRHIREMFGTEDLDVIWR